MRPETAIQIQIINRLSQFAEAQRFFYFSIPNEGFMEATKIIDGYARGGRMSAMLATLKKMGLTPGMPDLCVIKYGRAYFLEVKTDDGDTSKLQRLIHARLRACGCPVAVVRSAENAEETLKLWGVIA